MPNLDHRTFPFRFGIVAVCGLLLLGAAAESRAATPAQCEDEFDKSSAASSCTFNSATTDGDQCTIYYSCTTSSGGSSGSQSITSALTSVSGLRNCNGELWWNCS